MAPPHGCSSPWNTPSATAAWQNRANRVTAIVNGEKGIFSETAVLLAAAFGTTEAFRLNLQSQYDLEQARASVSPERVRKARELHDEFEAA